MSVLLELIQIFRYNIIWLLKSCYSPVRSKHLNLTICLRGGNHFHHSLHNLRCVSFRNCLMSHSFLTSSQADLHGVRKYDTIHRSSEIIGNRQEILPLACIEISSIDDWNFTLLKSFPTQAFTFLSSLQYILTDTDIFRWVLFDQHIGKGALPFS